MFLLVVIDPEKGLGQNRPRGGAMSVASSRCIPGTEHKGVQLFSATADDRPVSEGAQQRKRTTRWAGPGLLEAGLIWQVCVYRCHEGGGGKGNGVEKAQRSEGEIFPPLGD